MATYKIIILHDTCTINEYKENVRDVIVDHRNRVR